MGVIMLGPKTTDGPVPAPAPFRPLGQKDILANDLEDMKFVHFLDQDVSNIAMVQKGLRAAHRPCFGLSLYQESNIRHFHRTLNMYLFGERESHAVPI